MSSTLIIFGASGDLTSRKLIPALYTLFLKGRLPERLTIVGTSRSPYSDAAWRDKLRESTRSFVAAFDEAAWERFAPRLFYVAGDIDSKPFFAKLDQKLAECEVASATRVYYFSTAPAFYETIAHNLADANMLSPQHKVVVEKPFGRDLNSARDLDTKLHRAIDESRLFRIDHYLGKETVSNILALRFANAIFEPLWNNHSVASIQITANESGTIGHRAGYYDTSGVLRDMVQNHILQILTFVTMEPPATLDAKAIRDEKVKVLQAIRPMMPDEVAVATLRGQYDSYRNENGVAPNSTTPTFVALKLAIDNWRWKGVPIFLRTGKGMSCRTTQVVIDFKQPPHLMHTGVGDVANRLLLQLQPAEGIELYFQTKVPDSDRDVRTTSLSFNFRDSFHRELPDSYERLLLDAINGDASLFARSDEVEAAWRIIDPIQRHFDAESSASQLCHYELGGWGPAESAAWIAQHGSEWFDLCPVV
ncbi:MAG: glucose-6-phosphate dehydrogenase [Thermoguttaceae bacterium]